MTIESAYKEIHVRNGHLANERGSANEKKAFDAAELLVSQGLIDYFVKNGALDSKGIDMLVVRGTKRYKFQIKSSKGRVKSELERNPIRHRHGDILFLVPRKKDDMASLANRIIVMAEEFEERMHRK